MKIFNWRSSSKTPVLELERHIVYNGEEYSKIELRMICPS